MHAHAETTDLSRKSVPWIFYGQTTSLCETCWELVPAKIIGQEGRVYYQKRCPDHGVTKCLIEEDADYWLDIRRWLKPGDRPLFNASRTERGCPWDCGLCPDHEQHSCLAIVEINDACNLTCPVCFADSAVGKGGHKTLAEVEAMLDAVVKAEGEPDLVQLSGGEPTIHPLFWEIVAAARARPIRHIMVNTNGVRIAQEAGFAERLAGVGPGFGASTTVPGAHVVPVVPYVSPRRGGVADPSAAGQPATLPVIAPAEPVSTYPEVAGAAVGPDADEEPSVPDEARSRIVADATNDAPTDAGPGTVLHVRFAGTAPTDRVVGAMEAFKTVMRDRPGATRVVIHVPGPGGGEMELRRGVAYDADLLAEVRRRLGEGIVDIRLGGAA